MAEPVSSIRNLGPASDAAFARAGIHTAADLRKLGPDTGGASSLESGSRPHFIGYYAMVMGLMGRPWNDCRGKEKEALRQRFDAICAEAKPSKSAESEIEAILNEIGVVSTKV